MPALHPVPDVPPRALKLVRVSTAREEMVAPELQDAAMDDLCAARGYVVVGRIEGLDESGSQKRSPWWAKLDEAIAMVEAGHVDVILGWKFSRVARDRLRWAIAVDRVETAGGRIESATEPLDVTTSAGRLARGLLKEFDAFQSEQIGSTWREVHARRTKAGLPANGKPRFGYRVVDGVHAPEPEEGPLLASLYRRYIAGESIFGLVSWLNRAGYRTAPGYSKDGPGAWSQTTLRRCLDSGFGAGLITVGGELRPGAHEPVIDEATWERFRAVRASRRTLRRSDRSTYLLSGMMRCLAPLPDGSPCGSTMGGGQFGHARMPKFRCLAAATQRAHPGGYVMMQVAEAAVMDWLRDRAGRVDAEGQQVASRSPGKRRQQRDAAAIARELTGLEQQLVQATRQQLRGIIPEAAYVAARDEIEAEKAVLLEQHASASLAAAQRDVGPLAANLLLDWDGLTVAERRGVLRGLIARVEVVPGRPRGSVEVIPLWLEEKSH